MSEFFERRQRARDVVADADSRIEQACKRRNMTFDELTEAPDEDATATAYLQVSVVRLAELLERIER